VSLSKRREFLKTLGLSTAAVALGGIQFCAPRQRRRPNILFLFSDDQRFDTIHALGNPEIITPNLDRLCRRGETFTRAHIMGGTSGAVCVPSRAMLLTGRTLFHLQSQGGVIPEEHIMIPEMLQAAGYTTFGTGKWHNGPKAYARCFTHGAKIMFGGMSDHLKVPVHDFDPEGKYPPENSYRKEKFSSELFSDEAIRFLEGYTSDRPFFAYVSYTAPHDPRMAPMEYTDLYPPERIRVPENFMPAHPFNNGEMYVRDENLAPFPRTPEIVQEHIAAYYAMITHLDAQIGRVLDALEKTGRAKDTLVIFAGDNGLAVGQHGLLGKQNLYEHSVRVPLIICGPGIPEDTRSEALCYLLDLYPTLCDILGLAAPETVEGKSLLPVLKNRKAKVRDSLFMAYRSFQRAVRNSDNWKLIKYNVRGVETTQLFNLNEDAGEINNLAEDSASAARLEDLAALLKAHMRKLDDFCDLDKPNWGLPEEKFGTKKIRNLALGCGITLVNWATPKYTTKGADVLVDGIRASSKFNDGHWLGLQGEDLDAVIDLGKTQPIHKVSVGFLENQDSWIFLPEGVEFSFSVDGKSFHSVQRVDGAKAEENPHRIIKDFSVSLRSTEACFVRVKATSRGVCPEWHKGAGGKAWIFADEIVIE
jgi:arylsulfatase A-like enzyme